MEIPIHDLLSQVPNFQSVLVAVILVIVAILFSGHFKSKYSLRGKKLAPGSMGIPFIGESLSFLRAQKTDKSTEWIMSRVAKYGPIFKTSLMGSPVVVMTGQAGNRFIFNANDHSIASNQPLSVTNIFGKHNIFELTGDRYKLIRGAMMSFLRPESLQRFIGDMDSVVRQQLLQEFRGQDTVKAVPVMKKVTFKVTCSLLFGLPEGEEKDALFEDFSIALRGTWAIPVDFPGTVYRRASQARTRLCELLKKLVSRRREQIEGGQVALNEDVISCFLNLRDENGRGMTEEEIIDNLITLMIASHDTSAILLSLLVRQLSRDSAVYEHVLQEHNEILRGRTESRGKLTWNELQKMKYTWRVAQELMRINSPVFGNFKRAIKDTSFGGFDIPKGWQVFWVASSTHMDKNIFQEPEKFNPSRFENSSKAFPPYTYIPFGAGPRACPGGDFARIEVLAIIHHLVTNYRWSEIIPNEPITRDPMPYPAMGLPIKLHHIIKSLENQL